MTARPERVVENLNAALHAALAADPDLYLLGEDIADPYGGAFKATRGLSTAYPRQVVTTPISEAGIAGVAAGLALAGNRAIVEMMFGDFVTLAFDQIVNFAAKSVTMYGREVPVRVVVRCPTGGRRGYGPTHSQSLQKHFIGVPGLDVHEMSPFHDNAATFAAMLATGRPCVHFEDKVLYGERMYRDGIVDDVFRFDLAHEHARVFAEEPDTPAEHVVIATGGTANRALRAMRDLLLLDELDVRLLVPSRLYPLAVEGMLPALRRARRVFVVEESTAGGTWGAEVAAVLNRELWGTLEAPVTLVHSAGGVVPAAVHLERRALVSAESIRTAVRGA
ncbi:transketolase C-terminal domain-containing protein [Dactylosporangium darangshiense]|uniref:Pyruvate dehydrogenase E1 component subunit beta n=1 Tax=Dactylosporangium darangshiense TaxID=579108 RepID=A0ABP8DNR9_9ACTN